MAGRDDVRVRLSAEGVAEVVAALRKIATESDKSAKHSASGFLNLNSVLSGVTGLLGAFGVALGVGQLIQFAAHAATAAEDIGHMSRMVGASVENMSVLSFVTRSLGMDVDKLRMPLAKFDTALVNLQRGSGAAVEAFHKFGLSAEDLKGKDVVESLDMVAQRFAKLRSEPATVAQALDLFGRRGTALSIVLDKLGRDGLDKTKEKARALGVLMSEDMVRAAEQFNQQLRIVKLQLEVAMVGFLSGFLPSVTQALAGVGQAAGRNAEAWKQWGELTAVALKAVLLVATVVFGGIVTGFAQLYAGVDAYVTLIRDVLTGKGLSQAVKDFGMRMEIGKKLADDWRKSIGEQVKSLASSPLLGATPEPTPTEAPDEGEAYAARSEREGALREAALKRKLAQLREEQAAEERFYSWNIRAVRDHYAERRRIAEGTFEAEMKALRQRLALEGAQPDVGKAQAATLGIRAEMAAKEAEHRTEMSALADEEARAQIAAVAQVMDEEAKLAGMRGDSHEERMRAINAEIQAYMDGLRRAGVAEADRDRKVAEARRTLEADEAYRQASVAATREMTGYNLERGAIQSQVDAGLLSQVMAERQLLELERERVVKLREMAAALIAAAKATGDPEQMAAALAYAQGVDEVSLAIDREDKGMKRLGATFQGASRGAIADFFDTGIAEAKSWGEAFGNAALAVIAALRRVVAEMIATMIVQKALGFLGGGPTGKGGGSGTPAPQGVIEPRAASGGLVRVVRPVRVVEVFEGAVPLATGGPAAVARVIGGRRGGVTVTVTSLGRATARVRGFPVGRVAGPGGSRSDSIPAWLSHGEFVEPSDVVRAPGVLAFLEALRRRHPAATSLAMRFGTEMAGSRASVGLAVPEVREFGGARRFAGGGLVVASGPAARARVDATLTVGLEQGLVASELETAEAERAVVRVIQRNRRAVGNALRR